MIFLSSIYDKLKHFEEVILKDATAERDKILRQIEISAQERIALEKKKFEEQAEQLLKKETALAESEKNNIISRAIFDSRQLLVKKRSEIVDAVFDDTRKLLVDFAEKDGEYLPYLLRTIMQACKTAGDGDLAVILKASDMQRFANQLAQIEKDLPPHTTFEQTGDDIIGGCKVFNRTTNIIVDETLTEKLESSRDKILEICDLKI